MIDNFDLIANFLKFESPNDFYFLQILQRKKDDNECVVSSNYRVIKSYYIYSIEELNRRKDKIIELCNSNNARAYIWLNPRNTIDISFECIRQFTDLLQHNNTNMCYRVFDRACGKIRKEGSERCWIVDIDEMEYFDNVCNIINKCQGKNDNHIKLIIPSKHGVHIITEGFDRNAFYIQCKEKGIADIDIHRDNPTNLYIP
jgi:hypothetical protein